MDEQFYKIILTVLTTCISAGIIALIVTVIKSRTDVALLTKGISNMGSTLIDIKDGLEDHQKRFEKVEIEHEETRKRVDHIEVRIDKLRK